MKLLHHQQIEGDWNLAQVLAHSVVYFAREAMPPGQDLFCGSPPAPEPTARQLDAYVKYLPQLLDVTAQNVLPVEQALLDASKTLSPQRSQLEYDLYQQFGPQFAQVGSDIARQNAVNQAGTDLAVLQGPGKELAAAALEAQRQADPEYYKARELGLQGLQSLMGALPQVGGGLSGSERAEVDRSLAQSNYARGNETPTALSTIQNAMQFGAAGEARDNLKRQQISQAVNTATAFLNPAQSKVDVFQLTTGRPSTNTGETRFSGPQQAGQTTFGFGQQFMGETGQNARQQSAAITSGGSFMDKLGQGVGIANNLCCFIFLAHYEGTLPPHVRLCRNVLGNEQIRAGYRRMSRWLVPWMQCSLVVRVFVHALMIHPLVEYGGWLTRTRGYETGFVFRPIKRFWFRVWEKLGTTTTTSK